MERAVFARVPAASAALLGLLCVAAAAVFFGYETYPTFDSQYALVWGREILDGGAPTFDAHRAPTQHPLLVAVAVPLAALGDAGARVLVALCLVGLVGLIAAVHRLGVLVAGPLCGLAAAAIVASRLNFWLLASIGFLDIPYCALVLWALALEVERPRRGGAVTVLLCLAGLLRPEAWLLAGLYALHRTWHEDWARRARALAVAAVAPAIWVLTDLVVTGDPLFSIHHTDVLARELARERPLHELPWVMVKLLVEILKWPVLALALAGVVVAARRRERTLAVPAVLVLATCATYVVIAAGGLATIYRYLLTAGLPLAVFAAYGLTGWVALPRATVLRRAWAAGAALAVAIGAGYTVTHTSPAKARAELRLRERIHRDLGAVLRDRCPGPISVPNHKLVPDVRWILDLPDDAVRARSAGGPPPRRGTAILVQPRYERYPTLNVREVPSDDARALQRPPAGFRLTGANRTYAVLGRC